MNAAIEAIRTAPAAMSLMAPAFAFLCGEMISTMRSIQELKNSDVQTIAQAITIMIHSAFEI